MDEPRADLSPLSRRAARRLIQRAVVLAGRDRNVRSHIREIELVTLWTIEDWDFAWTVTLDRGRVHFERRPAKRPEVTLAWPTAAEFFRQVQDGRLVPVLTGASPIRVMDAVGQAFALALGELLENPVDENGDPLV